MKHHCHCGFEEQLHKLKARKLGVFGVVLFVLHLLYHVAECLILPTILVGLSRQLPTQPNPARQTILSRAEYILTSYGQRCVLSPQAYSSRAYIYNIYSDGVVESIDQSTVFSSEASPKALLATSSEQPKLNTNNTRGSLPFCQQLPATAPYISMINTN